MIDHEHPVPISRENLEQMAVLLGPGSYAVSVLFEMQQREARGELVAAYKENGLLVLRTFNSGTRPDVSC